MPLKKLEKQLDQAIEDYRSGSVFTVDTFDQPHYSEKEMKETIWRFLTDSRICLSMNPQRALES